MNIKDVLKYGMTGAREREQAAQGADVNPNAGRPGLESWRGPVGAISRAGGNIGRNVLGWFNGNDDRPPLLSRQPLTPASIPNPRSNEVGQIRTMPGPVTLPNPRDNTVGRNDVNPMRREMTPEEIQQQREQFDRYKDDPNSIYYQGGSARDPMPSGPVSRHRSPVRETYERSQAMTGSGEGFAAAKEHYRSLMQSRRDFQE